MQEWLSQKKDRKGVVPGVAGLILSVIEIIFFIVTFSAFLLFEKAPGNSLDIVPPYFGTATVTEMSESEQDIEAIFTTGTKQLTLDDVIELSSKGEELVWEDLSEFKGVKTGSGAVGKPQYAHLIYDDDEYVDIMTDYVEAFISEHS